MGDCPFKLLMRSTFGDMQAVVSGKLHSINVGAGPDHNHVITLVTTNSSTLVLTDEVLPPPPHPPPRRRRLLG